MKTTLILISALFILAIIFFFYLGQKSSASSPLIIGLKNNQLQPCPNTPNCVSSEDKEDVEHFIEPLLISNQHKTDPLKKITAIITEAGGTIHNTTDTYVAATFQSALFRFVDDFEVRLDPDQSIMHFRSASRVGKSDLGVNKKRVTMIKKAFSLSPSS